MFDHHMKSQSRNILDVVDVVVVVPVAAVGWRLKWDSENNRDWECPA